MPRAPLRFAVLLCVMGIAGCGPRPADPRNETGAAVADADAGDDTAARSARREGAYTRPPRPAPDALSPDPTAADAGAAPVGTWHLQESFPPRAVWGVPAGEGMLSLGCDRAAAQLVLERQAIGVPDGIRVVTLDADGVRMDFPAERRDDALAPVLVTRIALDAPIVDRLLLARRAAFGAGTDTITTTAPGASLQAVVDACRGEAGG